MFGNVGCSLAMVSLAIALNINASTLKIPSSVKDFYTLHLMINTMLHSYKNPTFLKASNKYYRRY